MYKFWKRALALILAATMMMGMCVTASAEEVTITEDDKPYIALGADLSASERATVLSLFGLTEDDLSDYTVVTVTNAQEHEYLDSYISSSTIGTRALSSVVIWEADKGSGINVTTKNISYCTSGMYENALATAGLDDVNVIVAGPSQISGTAALIGAIEAYSVMTNTTIDPDIVDGAIDEIVTTGELEESTGSTDEVEGLVAYLKDELENVDDMTDDELDGEIEDAADNLGLSLTDEEVEQVRELLRKLKNLNIDWDKISKQASNLFDKLESSGIDFGNLDLSFGDGSSGSFMKQVRTVFNNVINFFKGLFSRD